MAKWFCTICYHEHEDKNPPESCTKCGAHPKSIMQPDPDLEALPSNLEEVRDLARKKLKGFCAVYPACDGKPDRICQRESYGKPIGLRGAGSGASFTANVVRNIR